MRQLATYFEDYLKDIGKFDTNIIFGKDKESKIDFNDKAIIDKNNILLNRLYNRFKLNDKIIFTAVFLLCILFFIGIFFLFYYRNDPVILGGIFGGTFLSLLSIIHWLYKLWAEKSYIDISLYIIENESSENAYKFINNVYWKISSEKKSKIKR